ncbi:MAG: gamma-glutamylcyclotransferase family protein [Lautropia sp.]|nr:gamma-glutamylcyclotransferase family protein [Lautropia sp.]
MERLFSYGTLQQTEVQAATFGRLLEGRPDSIVGFRQELLTIRDPDVVALSGKTHHPILLPSGNVADTVSGTVFLVTPEELAHADRYEVSDYRRERVPLLGGGHAWAYIAHDCPLPSWNGPQTDTDADHPA